MNTRIIGLTAMIMAMTTVSAFARGPFGGPGDDPEARGRGFLGSRMYAYRSERKTESVTGTLLADKDKIPLLRAEGKEFILLFPWFLADDLSLEGAGTVTVTGFSAESPVSGSSQKILHVTTLSFGGKTWDVKQLRDERRKGSRFGDCSDDSDTDRGRRSHRGKGMKGRF